MRKAEIVLDRRQRHVHDRDVEDDHELRRHDEGQGQPAAAVRPGCQSGDFHSLGTHPMSSQIVGEDNYIEKPL